MPSAFFEAADQVDRPGIARALGQHVEHGTNGSQAGTACDDHQMLVTELLYGPTFAVGAPQEQGISGLLLEDNVGDLANGRMVNSSHPSPWAETEMGASPIMGMDNCMN